MCLLLAVPSWGAAEEAALPSGVYKFARPDGVVVYTDRLVELPPEVRRRYAEEERARQARYDAWVREVGKNEAERRALEQERKALAEQRALDQAAAQRLRRLNQTLSRLKDKRRQQAQRREMWQARVRKLRRSLAEALAAHQKARKEFERIAIQPQHTRLPGQTQKMLKAQADMARHAKTMDRLTRTLTEALPEEARRAGVPPGWLRMP